jgi:maleylpyruvate isomerase
MSAVPPLPQTDAMVLATARYKQALTVLGETSLREPSVLPGWTRGHVVAHLANHARASLHALEQVAAGEPAWLYPSQEERDAGVAASAGRSLAEHVAEAEETLPRLEQALAAVDPAHLDVAVSRLPGGPAFLTVSALPGVRRTEVEVHHADLGAGYGPADWPRDFALLLVGRRHAEIGIDGPSAVLRASDGDEVWKTGAGQGPEVSGTAADLAWWLVGRGGGAGLTSSTGELPDIGRWR